MNPITAAVAGLRARRRRRRARRTHHWPTGRLIAAEIKDAVDAALRWVRPR